MRFGLIVRIIVVVFISQVLLACNSYFEKKEQEKAERDFQKSDEGLPIRILSHSDVVDLNKEKDIGDVEDDLVVYLDIPDLKNSEQVKVIREEGRFNQIGRVEIEINPPYPQKLVGLLQIKSMGKVDYLKYPVLVEGKVINDKGKPLTSFRRYLPIVFGKQNTTNLSEENSPEIKFMIWEDNSSLQPSTFLLHAEVHTKVLDVKPGVDVLNIGDINTIGVKDETVLLSNPLRITLK